MSGYWSDFLTIAIAHWLAAASPGPDFAIVLKQSLAGGRKGGIWTAWGGWICVSTGFWFTLIATIMTHAAVRRRFVSYGFWIDRVMGGVFIAFAVILACSSL